MAIKITNVQENVISNRKCSRQDRFIRKKFPEAFYLIQRSKGFRQRSNHLKNRMLLTSNSIWGIGNGMRGVRLRRKSRVMRVWSEDFPNNKKAPCGVLLIRFSFGM
jgi:hypothetical protein